MGRKKGSGKVVPPVGKAKVKAWAKAVSGEWGYVEVSEGDILDAGFKFEKDLSAEELAEIAKQSAPDETKKEAALPELKRCPVCGGEAHVFKDIHGMIRCACKTCGFWDCVPWYTEIDAAESWNAAGGPNKVE